jgi:hypothetical protein
MRLSRTQNGPAAPGRSAWEALSGREGPVAAVHDLGFELGFEGLDLAEDGKAARGGAHLGLELVEDLVQPLGGGPESRVVLSNTRIHVHGRSTHLLDIIIVFDDHQC